MPPEPPINERIEPETPVDQEALAADVGCVNYHRYRDGCSSDGAFPTADVIAAVESVLLACERYDVVYRAPFVEAVIAYLREEMGK